MKKLIGFLFLGFAAVQGMAQKLTAGDCNTHVPIREVVRATESLGVFFNEVKSEASNDVWQAFQERAQQSPGLSAFDVFGERATQLRNSFVQIATTMEQQMINYISVVNPDGNRSDEAILTDFKKDMNCFISDPVKNSLDTLLKGAGIILPDNPPGPCDEAMRNCMSVARSEFLDRAWSCLSLSGGGLLRRLVGGIISIGSLLICESIAGQQHYDAVMSCLASYNHCRRSVQ